jgi:biopolymer transport protein ExbD
MASVGSEDGDVGFQIAPMVDVVFVLMLFFMASAGSQVVERELGINLPSGVSKTVAGRAVKPPKTPVIIAISAEGNVTLNNQPFGNASDRTLTSMRDWFKKTIEQFGDEDPVVIRPSPDTRHERIMDVLNAVGASGVKNLSFS